MLDQENIIMTGTSLSCIRLLGLVFWNLIHLEVASNPFCLLWNCPWLLVFALCLFFMILSGFNLYCWKGIHFSWSNSLIFLLLFLGLIFSFHFWFRDLLRELAKKYEILLMVLFLVFLLFIASEALLFVSFFWASFHSLSSPTLGTWPGEGFYLPDPCPGFYEPLTLKTATGLHFFHLSFGLFLSCLLFWSCSFPFHFFSPAGSSLHHQLISQQKAKGRRKPDEAKEI